YVLPGGFAYEDRIRAGAVAAHDASTAVVIEAAEAGKFVIGICNGAQILLETGLVPGTGPPMRPTAAFAPNANRRFRSVLTHVKLAIDPARSPLTAALAPAAVFPAWAAHGDGRLAASSEELARIRDDGHLAFVYCERDGTVDERATPNGSALGCAGLLNRAGNVLAIMPHPERIAWGFQQRDPASIAAARADRTVALAPAGGIRFFRSLAQALGVRSAA
ncbi:MAG: phosphoribosylformylglycinamidine synthase subunit PurQ, partial [Candidatus Dormibacteria bacterium]